MPIDSILPSEGNITWRKGSCWNAAKNWMENIRTENKEGELLGMSRKKSNRFYLPIWIKHLKDGSSSGKCGFVFGASCWSDKTAHCLYCCVVASGELQSLKQDLGWCVETNGGRKKNKGREENNMKGRLAALKHWYVLLFRRREGCSGRRCPDWDREL